MSVRVTTPNPVIIGPGETVPVTCDLTNWLASGEVPTLPVTTLVVTATGATYAAGLNGAPVLSGPAPYQISQSIHSLVLGQTYRLTWQFSVGATKVLTPYSDLVCE